MEKDSRVYDYVEGRNQATDRFSFDIDKLVGVGAVFVTPAMDGDPNSATYKQWLDEEGSHLITLYNVIHSSPNGWIRKAITKKADTSGWKDNFVGKLYDGKYNQILWSLEKLGIDPNDMVIENNSLKENIDRKQIQILKKLWDKNPVYDVNWFRKFLGVGYNDVLIRREFRKYLGGDDVVMDKVDKMLQNTFHVSAGGYNFDFKPLNWDIDIFDANDGGKEMVVSDLSCIVDAEGTVFLMGYDGSTWKLGNVMMSDDDTDLGDIAWEVDAEVKDAIVDKLREVITTTTGVAIDNIDEIIYDDSEFAESLQENLVRMKKIMGL